MTRNQIEYQKLVETQRANQASEGLKGQEIAETTRANLAKEAENERSHRQAEAETQRSNLAREMENTRSNQAREAETHRANTASEALGYANLSLGYSNLGETNRSNLARELETNRSNEARETEANRSNLAQEALKATQQRMNFAMDLRRDQTTRRGQDMQQKTAGGQAALNFIGNLGNSIIRAVGRGIK